ncbi:hypothetical protein [uncultured Helicobacter sp.]|uniref:hypothetical protein n=1 Tax=uncultured Helicobacter sp. TaxID=175537 RepID=UPI00263405A8|nr:hypothetical protein [uncultured Helicobacter sp.]
MDLIKTIRPFFATVIAGVEVDHKLCSIVVNFYRRGKLLQTQTKEFKTNPGELPIQAVRYIKKIRAKNPFTYVSTLSRSITQGVINSDKESDFEKHGINCNEIVYKRFDNNWSVYVLNQGIAETKKCFLKLGADFVISPFMVLYRLAKDTFQDSCKLYVLFQRSNMTLIVTKQDAGVLFGGYYVLESEINLGLSVIKHSLSEDEEDIQKTNIESDLQNELSGIENVLDLDSESDDAESLIKVLKNDDREDELHEEINESSKGDDLDDFSRIDTAAKFIQSALNEFYSNSLYNGEFISEVVIFNAHDIAQETLQQIQQITLLEVQVLTCDIAKELANLGYESYKFFESKGKV